jgi:inhibitor of KinA sporulation pathway (predicted exonuclease)
MAKDLRVINIVDIESTCWDKPEEKPQGEQNEIIEIGIVALDVQTLEITDKQSILIKPQFSTVSPFCTQLTTLTQELLDKEGVSLTHALEILKAKYKPSMRTWASYGDYDREAFKTNCARIGAPYVWGSTHLNIKNLLALHKNLKREIGMSEACKLLGIPMTGIHHRGLDDAENIAKIYSKIIR